MLNQEEIDYLMLLKKYKRSEDSSVFPFSSGEQIIIPLACDNPKELFEIIVRCGKIELQKYHFTNRARKIFSLFRIDLEDSSHINPDRTKITGPHFHIYTEKYGDAVAFPLPSNIDAKNTKEVLQYFMDKCNIVDPPYIQFEGLFQ